MLRFKSIYIEDMKSNIHPTYYKDAKVISAGKVIFTTGATVPEIRVDIHSGNHPFYTGKQRIIDTENLAKKFEKRSHSINTSQVLAKKAKKIERVRKTTKIDTDSSKLTLKDMLKEMQGK